MVGVSAGSRTDVGRVRSINEDRLYVGTHLWAVADGMGGHAAGEVASAIVIEHLQELDRQGIGQQSIVEALMAANAAVVSHGRAVPASAGLGTTVTGVAEVAIGSSPHWAVFNVGDSRVYRVFGDQFSRATMDHSEVEELILQGRLTEEEARHHASRSVITRSIGTTPAPQVDVWVLPQTPGERFVICSDGLTSELTDDEIRGIVDAADSPEQAADELVSAALRSGGRDNVSVVILDVNGEEGLGSDSEATNPRSALQKEVGR